MKLYEITNEFKNFDELFDSSIDQETGEIVEARTLELLEKELETSLSNKSSDIIKFLRVQELALEELDEEIKRLQALKKRQAKKMDSFKNYLAFNMKKLGKKKVETILGNLVLSQSTSVDIYDESSIPKEYKKMKVVEEISISKTEISKTLKAGGEVPGARLILKDNINIK